MTEHTPLPWVLSDDGSTIVGNPETPGFDDVCIIADLDATDFCQVPSDQIAANAALIVRAVNCHDDLLAALEDMHSAMVWLVAQLPNDERIADYNLDQAEAADLRAQAAIAKAKGG